jgi:hypothetical protein
MLQRQQSSYVAHLAKPPPQHGAHVCNKPVQATAVPKRAEMTPCATAGVAALDRELQILEARAEAVKRRYIQVVSKVNV